MLYDHLDCRVTSLARVRRLYDAILPALGYSCINADPKDRSNGTRIAFAASGRDRVDEIARLAQAAGAQAFEPPHLCSEYGENYYATFFEDANGNKFEICFCG